MSIGARRRLCPDCGHDHKPSDKKDEVIEDKEDKYSFKAPKASEGFKLQISEYEKPDLSCEDHPFNLLGVDRKLSLVRIPSTKGAPDFLTGPRSARKWLIAVTDRYVSYGYWPSTDAVRLLAEWLGADPNTMKALEKGMRDF